jgi:hypothetical protein
MAVVFRDGCDSYGSTADILRKWDANTGWVYNATAGRNGGGALQCVSSASLLKSRFGILNNTEVCCAFWVKISTTPAAAINFVEYPTIADASLNKMRLNTSGQLVCYAANNVTIFATGATNICDNNWHWIELRIKHTVSSNGGGSAYVDTVQQFSSFTNNANAGNADHITLTGSANATMTIDDFMVWEDTAGGPQLASIPLGPRQMTTGFPDGDGVVNFSRSTGSSNYALVDEQTFDSADYVESGTSGDQDLYDYAAIATSIASITEVCVNSVLINPNPGTINFQNVGKSGGNTTLGTSTITPSSYLTKQTSYPVDPATSAAWASAAAVNSAQFGIKVV